MSVLLLVLILMLSIYTLGSRNLLHGVIALSGVSLMSALLFYWLQAPDVAITEAAVGAGVSTVIFVWAIRSTIGATSGRTKGPDQ
jgi:energy-converting hydrogenase B subunit D